MDGDMIVDAAKACAPGVLQNDTRSLHHWKKATCRTTLLRTTAAASKQKEGQLRSYWKVRSKEAKPKRQCSYKDYGKKTEEDKDRCCVSQAGRQSEYPRPGREA